MDVFNVILKCKIAGQMKSAFKILTDISKLCSYKAEKYPPSNQQCVTVPTSIYLILNLYNQNEPTGLPWWCSG